MGFCSYSVLDMESTTRQSLIASFRVGLRMLPRGWRHDLWRVTEPQHDNAVRRIAQALAERIDDGFEVMERPPRADNHPGFMANPPPNSRSHRKDGR
jgi:hypothetical protein